MATKTCSKCKSEKPLKEFSKSRNAKDGLQSRCRHCVKLYDQKPHTRAGFRKCLRCKKLWRRSKGDPSKSCPECHSRCHRCNIKLTEDNTHPSAKRNKRYRCKKCEIEVHNLTLGNKGFKSRDYHLLKTYGITVNEYEALLAYQEGVCHICKKPPTNRRLSVDHKHEPGEKKRDPREKRPRVRGLLCWRCNSAIGKFDDDSTLLIRAADYLDNPPAKDIINPGEM